MLQCSASDRRKSLDRNAPNCYPAADVPVDVQGVELTLSEETAPTAAVLGGTLFAPGPRSGVRTVQYAAQDFESGLARVELMDGEVAIATTDLRSQCTFSNFAACPTTASGELSVDKASLASGARQLVLRATDAAGNRKLVPTSAVHDVNSPRSTALASRVRLVAGFVGSSPTSRIARYGSRATIRGRLTTAASGKGRARAHVDVYERIERAGAREVKIGSTRTRLNGTFAYRLNGRGPSRSIRLVPRPNEVHGSLVSKTLRLRVRAASTLRVSLRGTTVRFSGRVLSLPLLPKNKRLELHGRAPGFEWAPFAAVRADRQGRFSGKYHLPVRRPGVRLQIRIFVPVEHGYPYLNFRGPPLTVRVR